MSPALLVLCALASTDVVERANFDNPNLVLFNPGDVFTGTISLEYERVLMPRLGVTAGVWGTLTKNLVMPVTAPLYDALGGMVGLRVHFVRPAPGGLWLEPNLNLGALFASREGALARSWTWGASASLGYTFLLGRYLTFQLSGGGGFDDAGRGLVWSPRVRIAAGAVF
jgi:hypothetical protein